MVGRLFCRLLVSYLHPICTKQLTPPKALCTRSYYLLKQEINGNSLLISPALDKGQNRQQSLSENFTKMTSAKLDQIPDVEIDNGRFKYILIKVYDTSGPEEVWKYIIRGFDWAPYHADIYEKTEAHLKEFGLESECVGGGRILHDLDKKCLSVYGYSTGYGKADHAISTEILKKKFPDYQSITWSNEGY